MLPAYSLPESRTIDSDQSRIIGGQRPKPAASRRSVIRFMERGANPFGHLQESGMRPGLIHLEEETVQGQGWDEK